MSIILHRRGTEEEWNSVDPVLATSEVGYVTSGPHSGNFKLGDGTSKWSELPYAGAVGTGYVTSDSIANETIVNADISPNAEIDVSKLSGVVSQTNGKVTTASNSDSVVRNITVSTSQPTGGSDGQVWLVYLP